MARFRHFKHFHLSFMRAFFLAYSLPMSLCLSLDLILQVFGHLAYLLCKNKSFGCSYLEQCL